jgi:sulfatase maturation enzyme AslB (radical SAM superfamily)
LIADGDNESKDRLRQAQKEDPTWSKIIQNITEFGPRFSIKNDILYRDERVCMPRSKDIQRDIFHDIHDANGHLGFAKSWDKLAKQWYRTGMTASLKAYIQSCATCTRAKRSKRKPQGDMTIQRHITSSSFDAIALLGLCVADLSRL